MMYFLRTFSNKTLLVRAVALATAGSGVVGFTNSSDYNTSVSVSITLLRDSLQWPWRTIKENIHNSAAFTHSNHSLYGASPLFFSRPDSAPDANISNGADIGDSPKHSCNCLGRDTIANAATKVAPAVVHLSVPQGFHGITLGRSVGSGTIINEDGTILTCAHGLVNFQGLRSSSKEKIEVTLQDGRSFEGTVVNVDVHADIAILKIKSKIPLPTAKLGSSSNIRPGDWVLALGCPLTLQNTVTAGIVSCVDRKSSELGLGGMHREYLQTDCAINQGNSGGPLVNVDGEVVGINIMKVLGADGLNFAVPIDSASKIIEHFKKNGRVVRPWLGLKMLDLNSIIVENLKERNASFPDVGRGVLVPMVFPGSPADCAGFLPGDVVVEFGGKPIGSIKEIIEIMGDKIGKPFKAVVKRKNNVTETLTVIPEEVNPDM
ncbi:hypothetical protein ABFS83_14G187700 [Erythranthe nasuta]